MLYEVITVLAETEPAVSTAYARQMEPIVGKFYAIKPNEMELSRITSYNVCYTKLLRCQDCHNTVRRVCAAGIHPQAAAHTDQPTAAAHNSLGCPARFPADNHIRSFGRSDAGHRGSPDPDNPAAQHNPVHRNRELQRRNWDP